MKKILDMFPQIIGQMCIFQSHFAEQVGKNNLCCSLKHQTGHQMQFHLYTEKSIEITHMERTIV